MATTEDAAGQRVCTLCKRPGMLLVSECLPGHEGTQLTCADTASCARAQQARSESLARHPSGRSASRDTAEQYAASAVEARGQPGVALAYGLAGVTHALLAVAESVTAAPATDLVGVLDSGFDAIRRELTLPPMLLDNAVTVPAGDLRTVLDAADWDIPAPDVEAAIERLRTATGHATP